jgi:hypothetical protein
VILNERGEVQNAQIPHNRMNSDAGRWSAAEAEKQRLYVDARRNAALTQLSGGADLVPMGLAGEVPLEPPPQYSPREQTKAAIVVAPPSTVSSDQEESQLDNSAENDQPEDDGSSPNGSVPPVENRSTLEVPSTSRTKSPLPTPLESPSERVPSPVGLGIHVAGPPSPGPSSVRQTIKPLSDKEQMKRYYEAQERIEQNQVASGSSSQDHAQSSRQGGSTRQTIQPLSDKEQMRRFYEAQDRMNEAKGRAGSQGHDEAEYEGSGRQQNATPSSSMEPRFMTANEEKNMMKKRYEQATRQVSDHHYIHSDHGEGSSSSDVTPTRSTFSIPHASGSGSSHDHGRYMSAEEEKDQMKRRYEDAVQAMATTGMGSAGPSGSQQSLTNGSMSQRGSSHDRMDNGAAPPPIPTRPNDEYKNLLSPGIHQSPMGMGNPYFYGNPMLNPGFPMPTNPQMSPPMGSMYGMGMPMAPMGSMPMGMPMGMGMGMGIMPPQMTGLSPYAYGMPAGPSYQDPREDRQRHE